MADLDASIRRQISRLARKCPAAVPKAFFDPLGARFRSFEPIMPLGARTLADEQLGARPSSIFEQIGDGIGFRI